jgi:hypothetical protein
MRRHVEPKPLHHLPRPTPTLARKNNLGYYFNASTTTCNAIAYANDLAIITDKLSNMQPHINKLMLTPHIHIAHTIPHHLNKISIGEHQGEIRILQTYINTCRHEKEL